MIYAKFHCDADITRFVNKQINKFFAFTEQLIFA